MGVKEGNERYKLVSTSKHVSHVDLTLITFACFVNTLASYRICSNNVDLEGTPMFTEANSFPSFDQGKNQASSFYEAFHFEIFTLCS
jgi:hypothetical protein